MVPNKEAPIFKVENENDSIVHLSACCHPIPGDRIWAFQMTALRFTVATVQKWPEKDFLHSDQWALPESRLKGYKLNC